MHNIKKIKILSAIIAIILINNNIYGCLLHQFKDLQKSFAEVADTPIITGKTLYVGSNESYKYIQDAIDTAKSGDKIIIRNGTYNENLTVDVDNIEIQGEDVDKTIIEGGGDRTPVPIERPGIIYSSINGAKLSNITFKNCSAGLDIGDSQNITIENCKTEHCGNGISGRTVRNIRIYNCSFKYAWQWIATSGSILIENSIINENEFGIWYRGDTFMVDDRITVKNSDISFNNSEGITIFDSENYLIDGNRLNNNNKRAIFIFSSSITNTNDCNITNNELYFNRNNMIDISNYNGVQISKNKIYFSNDSANGIILTKSSNNKIFSNTIMKCANGINLYENSTNNIVYSNDFIDNKRPALDYGRGNLWYLNDKGNFWSNYEVVDINKDNIGDEPYQMIDGDARSEDKFPLMNQQFTMIEPTPIPTNTSTTITPTSILTSTPTAATTSTPTATNNTTQTVTPTATSKVAAITPTATPITSLVSANTSTTTITQPAIVMPGGNANTIVMTSTPTQTTVPTSKPTCTPTNTSTSTNSIKITPSVVENNTPSPLSTYRVDYKDINSHWGKESIKYVSSLGIMTGKKTDTFSPNDYVTRAECATVLVKLTNCLNDNTSTIFNDVDKMDWYYKYVNSAFQNEIMLGYKGSLFKPVNAITREDLVVILSRILVKNYGLKEIKALQKTNNLSSDLELNNNSKMSLELPFEDTKAISSYAVDGVATAINYGLVKGKSESLFDPKGKATRAELAAIISNLIKKYGHPRKDDNS